MAKTLKEDARPGPPRRGRGSLLLFESALIVASVALGFIVTEWRERAADRELSRRILTTVIAEVSSNRERLAEQIAHHREMIATFERLPAAPPELSGWDAIAGNLKSGTNALPLRRAAWDAAVSSGALRVIDYDIAARLSDIYTFQDAGYGRAAAGFGEALFVPETFTPGRAADAVRMFRVLVSELVGQETYMLEMYDRYLPALRAALADAEHE
ncbi:MAG: hypothetical protein M3Q55_10015 [Acidobacteriota bacterium]|nr:hypothetical protein [Acidobacteriota bacterium]